MTLLQPAALFLAAALAPIIVLLYLLRLRRRPATVSTLLFWQRVLAEQRRRAVFGRLRRVLSLLLQLLLLALLVLALARPEITGLFAASADASGGETATVLVLDCRARMQARETDGRTRFERARELLAAHARRAGPRRPAALLIAGHAPRVLAPLTDDDRALLAALDTTSPEDAGGSLDAALELAAELLAARSGEAQILVFTDRPFPPSEISNFKKSPIRILPVADARAPRENVALTRLSIRPRLDSPQTHEVFLQVGNFGANRQAGEIELTLDGRLFDVRPFDLAPGERRTEIYPALAADRALANPRGWLVARLARPKNAGADADALALDDDAFAVLPPARPVRVLLVSRGNWFLENLLRADDGVDFQQLAPEAFQPAAAGGFDAVLLDDALPDALARLDALPPAGNFLFIRRTPLGASGDPETLDRPLVADLDPASPLLRLVDWRQVTLGRAVALPSVETLNAGGQSGGWRLSAAVRAAGDRPLVVSGERRTAGGRTQRLAALAFGLTEGDLPLRVAFPLFMANTVRWLAGGGEESATPPSLRAGETLRLAVGETLWTRPLRAPRPAPSALPAAERLDGPGVFQPLQNGFYLLRRPATPEAPAGEERWLAVNTDDPESSALNASPADPAGPVPAAVAPPAPDTRWWAALRARPPWVPLALAAFALCALEWGLFHRRRTE